MYFGQCDNCKKVEEMKAQLNKQREKEVHLLNMEQMKPPYWDTRHADFCPVKVTNAINPLPY